MKELTRRILDISYKYKLSHIGSCLTCLPILNFIYQRRQPNEPVILSCGHAALALYVILEKYESQDAELLLNTYGIHPVKDKDSGVWCSTGSLGTGITVGIGHALHNRNRKVWVVISDGEAREGATSEALMFAKEDKLDNLWVYMNYNGYAAYKETKDLFNFQQYPNLKIWSTSIQSLGIPFLTGQSAHYYTMTEEDYKWVQENL